MARTWFRLGVVALAFGLAGCGEQPAKPITPVAGKVRFADGTPVPRGTRVVFNPGEGASRVATGETAEDGSYQLTHASGQAGAEEGKYSVQLLAPEGDAGEFFKLVPREYNDGSKLTAEVTAGVGAVDFTVARASGRKKN
jgi:hypothetical protein